MATVVGKSAKKQFAAYVGKFWSMSQRLLKIYSWIYENMIDENYSSFTKSGPNIKGNYKPEPEKREKREREREGEKKKTSTVFSFYSVDFGDFHKSRYIYRSHILFKKESV